MPSVNAAELRASLKSCIEFCQDHSDREYCERQRPLLERALERYRESRDETDRYYAEWREEWRTQKQCWKEVSQTLADVQDQLEAVNAVGYPDRTVRYWDEEELRDIVEDMIAFLEDNDDIEFAENEAGKLERKLEAAEQAVEDQKDALRAYNRRVKKRSDSWGQAVEAVRDFRELVRDELGSDHPEYESIRWPYAVSPDDGII